MGLFIRLLPFFTGAGILAVGKIAAGQGAISSSAKLLAAGKTLEGLQDGMELNERKRLDLLGLGQEFEAFEKQREAKTNAALAMLGMQPISTTAFHDFTLAAELLPPSQRSHAHRWLLRRGEMVQLLSAIRHESILAGEGEQAQMVLELCRAAGAQYTEVAAAVAGGHGVPVEWFEKVSEERLKDARFCASLGLAPK